MNHRPTLACVLVSALSLACRASVAAPPPPPRWPASEGAPAAELPGTWQDLEHAPRRLWDDGKRVLSDRTNWIYLAGATAFQIASESFEDKEDEYFEKHTLFSSGMQDALGALGNGLTLYAGALGWYWWAKGHDDLQGYEASKTLLSAMTVTAIETGVLKVVIHDDRPNGGSQDFPSGHASMTMATAATLDTLYGHSIGIPAYVLSGLVGLQRLDIGKHDTGAVVFGWALGFINGRTIATHARPRIFGAEVVVVRDEDSGTPGVGLRWAR